MWSVGGIVSAEPERSDRYACRRGHGGRSVHKNRLPDWVASEETAAHRFEGTLFMTFVYAAYGSRVPGGHAKSAYTSERLEAAVDWYLLGDRPYHPLLRRFLGPDTASPFDGGGLNRYAYCGGDPVNRIDPSGRSWSSWLRRALGLRPKGRGAPGTTQLLSDDKLGDASSMYTPAMRDTAVTPIVDTVVSVDIGRSSQADTTPGSTLLGHLATSNVSSDVALPAKPRALESGEFIGWQPWVGVKPKGSAVGPATVYGIGEDNPNFALGRLKQDKYNRRVMKKGWVKLPHIRNASSTLVAADTKVTAHNFPKVMKHLQKSGVKHIYVYGGAHGSDTGSNWSEQGNRLFSDPSWFKYGADIKMSGQKHQMDVDIVDLTSLGEIEFGERLALDGVHVIGCCYGAADPVVSAAMNLDTVVVQWRSNEYSVPTP